MAVFGHRVSHTHPFRDLEELHPGDAIKIESNGITYHYVMKETSSPARMMLRRSVGGRQLRP